MGLLLCTVSELWWIKHFPQCFRRACEICTRQDVPEKPKRPNRLREYNSKLKKKKKLFNLFEGSLSHIILLGSLPPPLSSSFLLFTLQVPCIHSVTSSFVFLQGPFVYEHVHLFLYDFLMLLFLGAISLLFVCFVLFHFCWVFFVFFSYYPLDSIIHNFPKWKNVYNVTKPI